MNFREGSPSYGRNETCLRIGDDVTDLGRATWARIVDESDDGIRFIIFDREDFSKIEVTEGAARAWYAIKGGDVEDVDDLPKWVNKQIGGDIEEWLAEDRAQARSQARHNATLIRPSGY